MGRISTFLVTVSVLLVSTKSFHLGFRTVSSSRKFTLQQSDADQISSSSGDVLNTVEATKDDVLPSADTTESAATQEVAVLSNPLVIEGADPSSIESIISETKAVDDVSTITSALNVVADAQKVVAPVVIKDLKLAALGPAYPDDTSYMMCSACKAGQLMVNYSILITDY